MYSTCTCSSKSHVKLMPEILLWVWPIIVMVIAYTVIIIGTQEFQ